MEKKKLLIATTNQGKYKEIAAAFETLPFDCLWLGDLSTAIPAPEEDGKTISENAILKARYYCEKTGLITLADDSGFFIKALDGWPGTKSARIGDNDNSRFEIALERMRSVPDGERQAYFATALCLVDPADHSLFLTEGRTDGIVLKEAVEKRTSGFGYDPIFFVEKAKKTYAEMSTTEKNGLSNRGKALVHMEYYLKRTYGQKQFIVPYALVVRDGHVLLALRNDPHSPTFHNTWEFPGGGVEWEERPEDTVVRETFEETGYKVEIVNMLGQIFTKTMTTPTFQYQIFLVPYVCRVVGGDGVWSDNEVMELKWTDPDDVLNHTLMDGNTRMYTEILEELKNVIQDNNL